MLKISFSALDALKQDSIALPVAEGGLLGPQGLALDKSFGGAIAKTLKAASFFKGETGQTLTFFVPVKSAMVRVALLGLGPAAKADALTFESLGGTAAHALASGGEKSGALVLDALKGLSIPLDEAAAHAAIGARLKSYRFDKYRTKKKDKEKGLGALAIACADPAGAKKAFAPHDKVTQSVLWARDLVSEPGNILSPEALMEQARSLADLGVEVSVLGEKDMAKLGMGALLCVAQGSARKPFLVALRWPGAGAANEKPIAFVGKGVTFDSGGISLKPGPGMGDMKYDMAGAAAVLGAMKALALRKARASVVGVVGLVENMPSGTAVRPGDVVTSAAGLTIEVLNTDAEGRLVLADALWYAQKMFDPRCIVDLATLTGAMKVALGSEYAGLFSNDDALAGALREAGEKTGEKLWRLPMGPAYDKLIDSPIADMKNIGGPEAGSVTAAQFLGRFIDKGRPWAHLDIAGKAWAAKDQDICPQGATAFGVRLLDRFVG